MEQTEIIDIKAQEELRELWSPFIHTHHYDVVSDFYDSWAAKFPRRSCEVFWHQFFEAQFVAENHVPQFAALSELQSWFSSLLEVEGLKKL